MTKAHGKLSIPGALTPTEVITAWNAGADYVKIFPCSAMGGATYLKSLLAPFPHLKLIPTGGVTLQTAESFLRAGARALGVGSDLVNLAAIDAGTPEIITEAARAYLKTIAQVRAAQNPVALIDTDCTGESDETRVLHHSRRQNLPRCTPGAG